ncbi:rho guanine nucleotide exchange factor 18-like [Molothrus aeneus]|uniref:rho guanine nucleotide exchange factor 18-like n=1 Tax=Molothrus aeneus TaxID=84833 RepID=UPI003458225B
MTRPEKKPRLSDVRTVHEEPATEMPPARRSALSSAVLRAGVSCSGLDLARGSQMSDSLLNHSWPSFSKRWKKRWSFKRGSDCKPCLREFTDHHSPALEYPTPKSFLPSLIAEDDSFCTSMAEEKASVLFPAATTVQVCYGEADCRFLNKGHLCSCAAMPEGGTSTSEHPAEADSELDLQEAQDSFPTLVRSMSTSRRHSWESPVSPVDCRRRFSLDVTELGSDPEQDDVEKRSQACLQPHVSLQLPRGERGAWSSSRGGTVIKVEIEPLHPDLVASPSLQEVKCVSNGKRLRSKSVPSACETIASPQIPHSFNTSLPAVEGVEPPALEMLEKDHVSPDHVLIVQKVLQELKHYHGAKQRACVQEGSDSSQQNLTWFEFLSNENEDSGKSDKAEKGTKVMRRLSSLRSRVTGSWQKDKGKNKEQLKEKETKETKERCKDINGHQLVPGVFSSCTSCSLCAKPLGNKSGLQCLSEYGCHCLALPQPVLPARPPAQAVLLNPPLDCFTFLPASTLPHHSAWPGLVVSPNSLNDL